MTPLQKLEVRQSERRQRLNEIGGLDGLDDEQRSELDTLSAEYGDGERQYRALKVAEDAETAAAAADGDPNPTGEDADRLELRSKCRVGNFLAAHLQHRAVTGAEAELAAELGTEGIPLDLWEPTPEKRAAELEKRTVAGLPGTVGVNLDLIRPEVFAPAVLPRLGVEMPRVPTGTYATATITTSQQATALAKGGAAGGIAGAITAKTATPKRISARLELAIEDIAAVGQDNFESALRQNLSLVLSDELDDQGLNGNGTAPNLQGLFRAISTTTGTAAGSVVNDFDDFVGEFADGVDGLWATMCKQVALCVGVETYRLAAKTFRDTASDGGDGETAFTSYAAQNFGPLWTSKRMPTKNNHVQQAILYRMGRALMGGSGSIRTAVCPVWGEVMIDDVYTGSAKAERYVTFHVLLGDVIVVQPDAYKRVAFRVSS